LLALLCYNRDREQLKEDNMPGLGSIGLPELLIVLVIIIIIFGVGKLPEIGGALGKGIREFRRASQGEVETQATEEPKKKEEPKES
jgi:sec-independent protein translocase protein TatA